MVANNCLLYTFLVKLILRGYLRVPLLNDSRTYLVIEISREVSTEEVIGYFKQRPKESCRVFWGTKNTH